MKRCLKAVAIFAVIFLFVGNMALAADQKKKSDRTKFGADNRIEEVKNLKVKTSTEKHRWKMVLPSSKGLLFYDMAVHFCDTVRLASGRHLDIKAFSAGELVPAMEIFDAVSKGSFNAGHDWPGYWKGKNEAFITVASVPYGLDAELYNIWLYERGGLEEMQALYAPYNLFALPGGQVGQEMGLNSSKRASTMEDFKGMKVRTWGWYLDILNELGASGVATPGVVSICHYRPVFWMRPSFPHRQLTFRWVLTKSPNTSFSRACISPPANSPSFSTRTPTTNWAMI